MYAIYGNIYHQYTPNVSIYTIHWSYGIYIYVIYIWMSMDYEDNVSELLRSLIAHPQLAISKGFIWVCLTGYLKKKLWLIIIFPIFPIKTHHFPYIPEKQTAIWRVYPVYPFSDTLSFSCALKLTRAELSHKKLPVHPLGPVGWTSMEHSLGWFKGKSTGNHGFYHQL